MIFLLSPYIRLLLVVSFLFIGFPVLAEEPSSPAVFIDRSVLEELNRYYGAQAAQGQAVPSSEPVTKGHTRPEKRTLIAPEIKKFPVSLKVKGDESVKGQGALLSLPPLPVKKPSHSVIQKAAVTKTIIKKSVNKSPLPPRRPAKQRASKYFVEQARLLATRAASMATTLPKPQQSTSNNKGGATMPAVPKPAVSVAPLNADKDKILQTVQTIARQTEGSAALNRNIPRPPPDLKEHELITLPFPKGRSDLNVGLVEIVERDILPILSQNRNWRLQIQAFAAPAGKNISSARRISLSRALAVRSFLLDKGLENTRIDVRALGMETNRRPLDRVDMVFLPPSMD